MMFNTVTRRKYVLAQKSYDLGQLYSWEGQILLNLEFVEMLKIFFTCFRSAFFVLRGFSHYLKTLWDCNRAGKCNPYVLEPFTIKSLNYCAKYFDHLKYKVFL